VKLWGRAPEILKGKSVPKNIELSSRLFEAKAAAAKSSIPEANSPRQGGFECWNMQKHDK
jgi:hypothetical protein